MKKFLYPLIALLIAMPSIASANTDAIIDGVTEFLIERAKENNFYIFETKLTENNDFKTYFPHTYMYVSDGDLKVLLTSKEIWRKAVEDDLDTLITRTFAESVNKEIDLTAAATAGMDNYLDLLQYLSVEIRGVQYPLNIIPIGAPQDVRDTINGFWNEPVVLRDDLAALGNMLKDYANLAKVRETNSSDLLEKAKAVHKAFDNLDRFWRHVEAHKDQLRINTTAIQTRCTNASTPIFCRDTALSAEGQLQLALGESKAPLVNVLKKARNLVAFLEEIRKPESDPKLPQLSRTEKVIMAMRFLKANGLGDATKIDKLKRHVLFFARLSDVTKKEEVKEILVEYTMPAVSFNIKREKDSTHFLLTSYLGYGHGRTYSNNSDGRKNDHGIIAPIGLELSRGTDCGSFSLMLAPIDLGYPVTLKLNGIEEKLSFSDIFAPGVYVAYGLRKFPANIGIAWQRGRRLPTSDDTEYRLLAFISYDMPLLNLY